MQEAYLGHAPGAGGAAPAGEAATDDPGAGAGLTIEGVHAAYGRIEVLHGVDLAVAGGSVFALLGPNGAGKSTLLKVVNGRLRPPPARSPSTG